MEDTLKVARAEGRRCDLIGLVQGGHGRGEKSSDFRCILKVDPAGFTERLEMGCERKMWIVKLLRNTTG